MDDKRAKDIVAMLRHLAQTKPYGESWTWLADVAGEIERLRAALEPFAAMADHCERHGITSRILASVRAAGPDGSTVWVNLTLPDCRHAAEVLK